MLAIDILSNNSSNPRWNINNFLSPNKKREVYIGNKDIPKEEVAELDKILRHIDIEYNKIFSEFNSQEKLLSTLDSQLKKRIDAFSKIGEPGEIEIQYRKMALDIITSRTKISIEKSKLHESKIKQIREERKFLYDKLKNNGGLNNNQPANNPNGTSPIDIANSINSVGLNNIGMQLPASVLSALSKRATEVANNGNQQQVTTQQPQMESGKPEATFQLASQQNNTTPENSNKQTIQQETPVVNTSTTVNNNTNNSSNVEHSDIKKEVKPVSSKVSVPNGGLVINPNSYDLKTNSSLTLEDQYNKNLKLIEEREKHKKTILKTQEGLMGAKYTTSLTSLVGQKENIEEVLYVDKQTGRYWLEGYVTDPDTGEKRVAENYLPKSLLHIGNIRFDAKNSLAKMSHYDDAIRFSTADESKMPRFYVKEWDKDSSSRFILEESVLELLP